MCATIGNARHELIGTALDRHKNRGRCTKLKTSYNAPFFVPLPSLVRHLFQSHFALWLVFSWGGAYDLLPTQLQASGLLLGQDSKWRAQRADLCNRPLFYIVSLIVQSSSTSEADAARISPS